MTLVTELVLASHNPNKIKELTTLLVHYGVKVYSTAEFNIDEPEETGATFAENALLKARNAAEVSGKPALADDSGFVIDALGYFPGVISGRYAKSFASLDDCYLDLAQKLGTESDRRAYFECALCYYKPDGSHQEFSGRIDGQFVYPARGNDGFCFDFVFQPTGYNKTFAELGIVVKNTMSHRAKAMDKFIEKCLKEK